MAKLPEVFNFGDITEMQELIDRLGRMYTDLAVAINQKPDLYQRTTDGQSSDTNLSQGSLNINLSTDKVEMLTNHTSATTVNWVTLG